jgi:D-beta-D-heptose 7-phosphate kinase/D-beta-D-heptose 1-phosphate adenosyltransferase
LPCPTFRPKTGPANRKVYKLKDPVHDPVHDEADRNLAALLTPNRHEALELAGLPEPGAGEAYPLEDACSRIHEIFAPKLLVITLGADGMAVCRAGKVEAVLATAAREVFDVSGAGDTLIDTLTVALAAGATAVAAARLANLAAARLANLAAGVVVSHMGTATASPEELLGLRQDETAG